MRNIRILSLLALISFPWHCKSQPFEMNLAKAVLLEPSVNHGELGTFERDGEMKHVGFLPMRPEAIKTKFIYTTLKAQPSRLYYTKHSSLKAVKENTTIAMLVHGFHSSAEDPLIIKLQNSILNFTTIKAVVLVDWEHGANCINYFQAVANAQLVGRQTALIVEKLRKHRNINPKDIHLIGFSLGAQLTGFAARWAKKKYKFTFGRISALDAAMYLFEDYRIHVRKGDALFVDAIHTSAGSSLVNNQFGSIKPFADIDFYPNGGQRQPHCENSTDRMCNHLAALIYYETSIKYRKSCEYLSVKCASYRHFLKKDCYLNSISRMGYCANTYKASGKHYLQTTVPYPHKSPQPSSELFYFPRKLQKFEKSDSIKSVSSMSISSAISFISVNTVDLPESNKTTPTLEEQSQKTTSVDEKSTPLNKEQESQTKETEKESKQATQEEQQTIKDEQQKNEDTETTKKTETDFGKSEL